MNKELENILLSENERKLEKVNDFLDEDYKQTLREIFAVLLDAIKTKAMIDINTIMSNIEKIILSQDSSNFKIINTAVREANHKMNDIKKCRDDSGIKRIKFRLIDLNRQMLEKKEQHTNNSLYNFYHYLIFEEKNLDIIESLLRTEKNILNKKDEFDNNLLHNIVDHYCSLNDIDEEHKEEIRYFYEVIIMILKNEEDKLVKEDKQSYLDLLNRKFCKNKKHVREITERFQEFYSIDINNLERKYHVYSKMHDSIYEELKSFKFTQDGRITIDSNFITIDEEDAICLDDAISLRKNKDGSYDYYIAITDIPSLIPYESLNYYEAMKRIETIYLCDKTINMYHPEISNNLCSLLPEQWKNVIIYKTTVDPQFVVDQDSLKIIKGRIKVKNKLTYRQVNKHDDLDEEILEMLERLAAVTFNLRSQNKHKEKYRKIENLINSTATYHHSIFADTSISANIVQESMLLANHLTAKYFEKEGLVYLFRNLQISNEVMVNDEVERLMLMSHVEASEMEYQKIFNMLKESYLTANYSTINKGHQGLGYSAYSHVTSAARRFSDSFNQYLTHNQIFEGPISDKKHYELEITAKEVVEHINNKKKENAKFANEYNYLNSKKLIRKR